MRVGYGFDISALLGVGFFLCPWRHDVTLHDIIPFHP
jgi:hypothetical protein